MSLEKSMEVTSRRALNTVVRKMDLPLALGVRAHTAQKACNTEASLQGNPQAQSFKAQPLRAKRTASPKRAFRLAAITLYCVISGP